MSLLTRCARTLLHAARPAVARAHGTRGRRRRPAHRAGRSIAVVLAGGLAAGAVALGPAIQSSEPAQAALPTVNLGSMRALLPPSALTGRTDSGNSVDCLYRGTGVWAYANQWSRQGHGNVMPENQCKAGEIRQSRVHLTPGTATSATVGTPFVVAAISHRNNPTAYPAGTGSIYISGTARVDIPGVTATLDIPWELHETPDNLYYAACPTDPFNTAKCPDRLSFPAGIERSFSVGPVPYTFRVIHSQIAATGVLNGGFDNGGGTGPPDLLLTENTPCPAPSGTRVLSNVTPEDKVTKICIYAEIVQERTLRVAKQATPQDGTSFPFTSSSDRAGSPWGAQSFSLTSGQSRSQPVQAGETVRIQEGALPAEWVLSSIVCRDGAGGTSVGAEYDLATRSVRLAEIPVASSSAALAITCTFLNEKAEPEPQERTLRVLKQTASPADGMSFLFRSSSDRAGSPWGTNQAFWLGAGQSRGPEAVRPG